MPGERLRLALSRHGRSTGNLALELGLVLPLFLLIIAGTLDLGMLYWKKHILTYATREGARAAALASVSGAPANTQTQVVQVMQNCLDRSSLTDADGNRIVLSLGDNVFYGWDTTTFPGQLWVELKNIPVRMMLLPNVEKLYGGEITQAVLDLSAGTTMSPEWTGAPPP